MKSNKLKNQRPIVAHDAMNKKKKKEAFSYSIYNNENFKNFCQLEEDSTTKFIAKKDLPLEFNEELCDFLNLFRRKTVNENTEWEFYIDYENDEIIHCFHGEETEVKGWINAELMKNRNICSIHNHVKGTYSAPSAANFEILNHEFEKYEIICADEEYWIVEAKDTYENEFIENLKKDIKYEFDKCDLGIYQNNPDEIYNSNEEYSKRLSELINNSNNNIILKRKEYR